MANVEILFVTERYWPALGGIEEGLRHAAALLKKHYSVTILTMRNSLSAKSLFETTSGLPVFNAYEDPSGVRVLPLLPALWGRLYMLFILLRHLPLMRRFFPNWSHDKFYWFFKHAMAGKLVKFIYNKSLVICFSGSYLGILSLEICRKYNIPIIYFPSIHPHQWNDSPKIVQAYRGADAVAVYVESTKKYLQSLKDFKNRIHVIPLPIQEYSIPESVDFRHKHSLKGVSILFVGRREKYKGIELLLKAFNELVKKTPSTELILIGPQVSEKLIIPVSRCVDLYEADEKEKAEAFAACDIFCLPSTSESLGLVYLEAWYNGKPVIACRIPEMEKLIDHGVNGLLVDANFQSLYEALDVLVLDKERREAMGKAGKEKYLKYYSNSVFEKKMVELVNGVTTNN